METNSRTLDEVVPPTLPFRYDNGSASVTAASTLYGTHIGATGDTGNDMSGAHTSERLGIRGTICEPAIGIRAPFEIETSALRRGWNVSPEVLTEAMDTAIRLMRSAKRESHRLRAIEFIRACLADDRRMVRDLMAERAAAGQLELDKARVLLQSTDPETQRLFKELTARTLQDAPPVAVRPLLDGTPSVNGTPLLDGGSPSTDGVPPSVDGDRGRGAPPALPGRGQGGEGPHPPLTDAKISPHFPEQSSEPAVTARESTARQYYCNENGASWGGRGEKDE